MASGRPPRKTHLAATIATAPDAKIAGGLYWSGRLDSNQRPLRPERSALPG